MCKIGTSRVLKNVGFVFTRKLAFTGSILAADRKQVFQPDLYALRTNEL